MKDNRRSNTLILITAILFLSIIGSSCSSQKDINHNKEIEILKADSIKYLKPVNVNSSSGNKFIHGVHLSPETQIIVKSIEILDIDSTIIPAIPIGGDEAIILRIVYPELAKRAEIEGNVWIEFEVDKSGNTNNLKILKDIGGGCSEQVINAISKTKFYPGKLLNENIESRYRIAIQFKIIPINNEEEIKLRQLQK